MSNTTEENNTTDTVSATRSTSLSTIIATACVVPLCIFAFVLNLIALVLLKRSKKLRKNKFYCSLLCLSISDIAFTVTCFIIILRVFLQAHNIFVPYICFGGSWLTSIAITFSWIQVLFVCMDRLLATFSTRTSTNWKRNFILLYSFSFAFTAIFVSVLYLTFGESQRTSCTLYDIFQNNYWVVMITRAVVHLVLYCFIVTIYIVVIRRLQNQMRKINVTSSGLDNAINTLGILGRGSQLSSTYDQPTTSDQSSSNQIQQNLNAVQSRRINAQKSDYKSSMMNTNNLAPNGNELWSTNEQPSSDRYTLTSNRSDTRIPTQNRINHFKSSMSTVGIVILFATVSMLPGVITSLIGGLSSGNVLSPSILEFTSSFVFISPLFDPLIYVLRIKEFRSKLKCRCS